MISEKVPPLIHHLLDAGGLHLASARGTTITTTSSLVCEALAYLCRGRPGDGHRADACLDEAFARVDHSHRFALLHWSGAGGKKIVRTLSEPIDEHIYQHIGGRLIVKEYFTDGSPDLEKNARLGALYADLYYRRLGGDLQAPLSEIVASTPRRTIALRQGLSLAYEHLPACPADELRLRQHAMHDLDWMINYLHDHPLIAQAARQESYGAKLLDAVRLLEPFVPSGARHGLKRAACADAEVLEHMVRRQLLIPHIDPTAVNMVVADGALRNIDYEKVISTLVCEDHLRSHFWFDPAWSLSIDERVGGLGEHGIPIAAYYCLRQASRGLSRRYAVPFATWAPTAKSRLRGYLSCFLELSGRQSALQCMAYLAQCLDLERLDAALSPVVNEALLKVQYHRCA